MALVGFETENCLAALTFINCSNVSIRTVRQQTQKPCYKLSFFLGRYLYVEYLLVLDWFGSSFAVFFNWFCVSGKTGNVLLNALNVVISRCILMIAVLKVNKIRQGYVSYSQLYYRPTKSQV